jgi:hypothetical protein
MTPAASQANDENVCSSVGQPILTAAGFQPAFAEHEGALMARKSRRARKASHFAGFPAIPTSSPMIDGRDSPFTFTRKPT